MMEHVYQVIIGIGGSGDRALMEETRGLFDSLRSVTYAYTDRCKKKSISFDAIEFNPIDGIFIHHVFWVILRSQTDQTEIEF